MGAAPRTIAVTVRVEDRLQLLFQQHRCRGLGHPVRRVRHAEHPDPRPMILRYLHRPHRPREIASRGHPIPQQVKVVPLPRRELGDADGVHARRPVVGPDLLPRLKHEALGDLKRLHLRLGSVHRLLPRRVGLRSDPGLPGPFAPAPLQDLHRYYGPVRPCAPHRYSAPHGCRRLGSSLSPTGRLNQPTSAESVSGRQVLLFHASAYDELTPPIHRTPPGQHAGRLLAHGTPQRARLHPGDT